MLTVFQTNYNHLHFESSESKSIVATSLPDWYSALVTGLAAGSHLTPDRMIQVAKAMPTSMSLAAKAVSHGVLPRALSRMSFPVGPAMASGFTLVRCAAAECKYGNMESSGRR